MLKKHVLIDSQTFTGSGIVLEKQGVGNKNWPHCIGLGKMPPLRETMHIGMMMATKSEKKPSFETAMADLEQLVADMESGKLSLEDSLAAYKRGAELMSYCRTRLEEAQQQVRVLEDSVLKDFNAGDAN